MCTFQEYLVLYFVWLFLSNLSNSNQLLSYFTNAFGKPIIILLLLGRGNIFLKGKYKKFEKLFLVLKKFKSFYIFNLHIKSYNCLYYERK